MQKFIQNLNDVETSIKQLKLDLNLLMNDNAVPLIQKVVLFQKSPNYLKVYLPFITDLRPYSQELVDAAFDYTGSHDISRYYVVGTDELLNPFFQLSRVLKQHSFTIETFTETEFNSVKTQLDFKNYQEVKTCIKVTNDIIINCIGSFRFEW